MIIDPSCDLKTTTKRILWGKVVNAGQTCVAPDYVLVPKDFQDKFVGALKETCVRFFFCFPADSPSLVYNLCFGISVYRTGTFYAFAFLTCIKPRRILMLIDIFIFPVMRNSTLTPINAPLPQVLSVASLHLKPPLV